MLLYLRLDETEDSPHDVLLGFTLFGAVTYAAASNAPPLEVLVACTEFSVVFVAEFKVSRPDAESSCDDFLRPVFEGKAGKAAGSISGDRGARLLTNSSES